jgi:hypothetical protein
MSHGFAAGSDRAGPKGLSSMRIESRTAGPSGIGAALLLGLLLAAAMPAPASAQGFFDLLFGGFRRSVPPPAVASPGPYADPRYETRPGGEGMHEAPGPGVVYCVRLCDGRHFPINYRGGMGAAEVCRSFCPAAPTQIFSGSAIGRSVAPNGRHYSELPNAFVYREKLVPDCTCDGKSPTGLVSQPPEDDPTLRPGDIVAARNGLMVYRGDDGRTASFAPVEQAPGFSPVLRRQLSQTRILPSRTAEEVGADAAGVESRNVPQRDQAVR